MAKINEELIINSSMEQCFKLIDRVEDYPKFVPGCAAANIFERNSGMVIAELKILKGGFSQSFYTKNTLHPHNLIELELVDGPFKHLHGFWKLEELSKTSTKVILDLDLVFNTGMLDYAFGAVFQQVTKSMLHAFKQQAELVYG